MRLKKIILCITAMLMLLAFSTNAFADLNLGSDDGTGFGQGTTDNGWAIKRKWDLLIAHPPCTYLTSAGSCCLFDKYHNVIDKKREEKLWDAVDFFKQFLNADCDRIAVEKPAPMKYCRLPKYTPMTRIWGFDIKAGATWCCTCYFLSRKLRCTRSDGCSVGVMLDGYSGAAQTSKIIKDNGGQEWHLQTVKCFSYAR